MNCKEPQTSPARSVLIVYVTRSCKFKEQDETIYYTWRWTKLGRKPWDSKHGIEDCQGNLVVDQTHTTENVW